MLRDCTLHIGDLRATPLNSRDVTDPLPLHPFRGMCILNVVGQFNRSVSWSIKTAVEMYNGHGHWLTITLNIGAEGEDEVLVYDNLYQSVTAYMAYTNCCPFSHQIRVKLMDMQILAGTCDCGLFAIAMATALLSGVEPGACTFKQTEMRKHLYDGFKRGRILTTFPMLKKGPASEIIYRIISVHFLYAGCQKHKIEIW